MHERDSFLLGVAVLGIVVLLCSGFTYGEKEYQYRRKITTTFSGDQDLKNFPIVVKGEELPKSVKFYSESGHRLPYKKGFVTVPNISTTQDTIIYAVYNR